MAKVGCVAIPVELGSVAMIRWLAWGREKQQQQQTFTGGRRLRRRRGGTVRLGSRRPRLLLLRRLVRWSQVRWRVVVELFGPIKKALMEVVAGRELMQQQSHHLALPFICHFPVPLV